MAAAQSCGKPAADVVRILRSLKVLQVAARALHLVPVNFPFDVALRAGPFACAPVSGKRVFEWSNFAPCHGGRVAQRTVLRESGGTWFGFLDPWKSFRWQPAQ